MLAAASATSTTVMLWIAVVAFVVETVLILLNKPTGWLIPAGLACFAGSFLALGGK